MHAVWKLRKVCWLQALLYVGKNKTAWKCAPSSEAGRGSARNIFIATGGVPKEASESIATSYDSWKHFIPEAILLTVVKYTNEEAQRREEHDFDFSICELEISLVCNMLENYGKNHPIHFLYN